MAHSPVRSLIRSAPALALVFGLAAAAPRAQAAGQPAMSDSSLTVEYTIGSFQSAVSLAVNAAGELVVLDAGADALVRLAPDGTELARLQGRGWGPTEFDSPTDVSAAFPLAIFVADGKNYRLQQFDKDLHFVQSIGRQDDQPVLTQETDEGQLLERTFRPTSSTESAQGELFVLDADGNRIVKFTTRLKAEREFGTYASGQGRLSTPSDLCMTEDGRVAAADGNRIVFFDQFGNYLSTAAAQDTAVSFRAVSASGGDVIAVSSDAVAVIDASPSSGREKARIGRSMIIGESVEEFRDASRTAEWWFLLTPKSILVCRRTGF